MKSNRIIGLVCFGSLFLCGLRAQVSYSVTNLGLLPGYSNSVGCAVNDSGLVAGDAWSTSGLNVGFTYGNGQLTNIGAFSGGLTSVWLVSDAGEVVGGSTLSGGGSQAFVYSQVTGQMTPIAPASGYTDAFAAQINASGQLVGYNYNSKPDANGQLQESAFFYDKTTDKSLVLNNAIKQTFPTATESYAIGINNNGQIVGAVYANSANGFGWQPFIYSGGAVSKFTGGFGYPEAINSAGVAVGQAADGSYIPVGTQALKFAGGVSSSIGTLGGSAGDSSVAYGINDSGLIVGASTTSDGSVHAFSFIDGTTMVDLNSRVDLTGSGFAYLQQAWSLNNAGQIVGLGIMSDSNNTQGFLLTSIPEPSTYAAILGLTALGFAAYRRRRRQAG